MNGPAVAKKKIIIRSKKDDSNKSDFDAFDYIYVMDNLITMYVA
jgi:hypothetical protein